MALVQMQDDSEYVIKPEVIAPRTNAAEWPLLLANYESLLVRSGHFTPIPAGCTPLRRELKQYISSGVINCMDFDFFTAATLLTFAQWTSPAIPPHTKS